MDTEDKKPKAINPRVTTNPIAALLYFHLFPIFKKSYKKGFREEDLYQALEEHKSSILGDNLENLWLKETSVHKKTALLRALLKLLAFELSIIGLLKFAIEIAYVLIMPYAIGGLVTYFKEGPTKSTSKEGYIYATLIILSLALYSFIGHSCMMAMMHIAMKTRVACCSLIYRKSLRLSQSSLAQTTIGHMVNLLSNDVSKFDHGLIICHYVWISPIQAAVGTYLLYRCIGISAFSGIIFLLLFVPLQVYLGKRNSYIRLKTALRTDERVRLMDEILSGIQAIKMYTWEKPFTKLVSAARRLEISSIRAHYYLEAIMYSLEMFVTRTSIFISFVVFIYLGNHISADSAYTVTAIYGVMRPVITMMFSYSIAYLGETLITIKRLQEFMVLNELSASVTKTAILNGTINDESHLLSKLDIDLVEQNTSRIFLKGVNAKWLIDSVENTLNDINLNIAQSQLVAIIGPVGSGKSSIMNVILRELPITGGYMETEGTISYACQEAWLFSATVRQNILFGAPYEESRYKTVIKVCALESDLKILPNGDRTIVGERGSALSGGQQARINLARCIYKRADIYLLDDPLSAVDTKVGRRLFDECITKFLHDKICVLVTHQLQYLKNANKILILKKGEIIGSGSYDELQSSGLDFAKLLQEFSTPDEEEAERRRIRSRQSSELSLDRYEYYEAPVDSNKERFETGKIATATYATYFRAGGNYFVMILLAFAFIVAQSSGNAGDYMVAHWVNVEQDSSQSNLGSNETSNVKESRKIIIYTYSGLTFMTIIFGIGHCIFFFMFFMRASINMHDSIFSKISMATMRFFNINPMGRILNRFSKDIGIIDEYIPFVLIDIVHVALLLVGTITVTSIVNPWLLVPTFGLFILFYFLRLVYVETSRNVKRIEGITRSPMFNHITATMDGLSTIRAFSAQKVLAMEFDSHQDHHSSAWYLFIACSRAFGFWIDMICTFFIGLVTVGLLTINRELYYGGDVGLLLTQYLNLTGILQWGMRQWSELENNMTSVERVLEYTKVETEPEHDSSITLPEKWPQFGEITFKHVSLKYDSKESPVLKDLNFTIEAGEKIGVVGRTGAGKSSTIAALFQLYEIEGAIVIDGIDTTKIPLDCLRPKISIIPQAPVLFSGTMRKNLDPFEEFDDDVLWNALEEVELKDVITESSHGLSLPVSESGTNFSIGQRQLVCLARAIIRNNKILVMDEATANVDPHTDGLIQKTIRKKFADCTVITIAHRLHTVMDSDRILVMDAGRMVEFDLPHNLLQHTESVFYSMVQTTGKSAAQKLKTVAEERYLKMK